MILLHYEKPPFCAYTIQLTKHRLCLVECSDKLYKELKSITKIKYSDYNMVQSSSVVLHGGTCSDPRARGLATLVHACVAHGACLRALPLGGGGVGGLRDFRPSVSSWLSADGMDSGGAHRTQLLAP